MAFASDAQRKLSSGLEESSVVIKSSAGKAYGITAIATAANGYATVYDSSTASTSNDTVLFEIQGATQNDSKTERDEEGINAYEGIYLELNDAKAIVYYY